MLGMKKREREKKSPSMVISGTGKELVKCKYIRIYIYIEKENSIEIEN